MEIQIPSIMLSISFIIFPTLIFFQIIRKLKTQKKNTKHLPLPLPPGPRKLPLIGNLHNLAGGLPHHVLHRLSRKFGPIMSLQLGELSAVIISSADAAKEIMKTHDLNFASRPPIAAAEIISYGCKSISFSPYGDHWRQLRKICTMELLSAKRVQSFRPLREGVFADLCRKLEGHSKDGSEVNFSKEFSNATYALIARAVLGEEAERHEGLLPNVKEMPELGAGFDIAEVFPSVGLFKVMSRLRKRIVAVHEETDVILDDLIYQHRIAKNEEHKDLLDVLLKIQGDGVLKLPLTTEHVKSVLVVSF